jgi:hypothetical protein
MKMEHSVPKRRHKNSDAGKSPKNGYKKGRSATGSATNQARYAMGSGNNTREPERQVNHFPPSSVRSRVGGIIPPLPHTPS